MRIQGQELKRLNIELIIIPRGDGEPIVMKAQAVSTYDEFNLLVKEPEAPWVIKPGTGKERNYNDKGYQAALSNRSKLQTYYMFLKSLQATEGLVWDTIDMQHPDTWLNFEKELEGAGFSAMERNLIVQGCMTANCLNERKLEEARNRFIQSQAEPDSRRYVPKGRTVDYAIWRACERIGIKPPEVMDNWDNCGTDVQALIIAYSQLRDYEEFEEKIELVKVRL